MLGRAVGCRVTGSLKCEQVRSVLAKEAHICVGMRAPNEERVARSIDALRRLERRLRLVAIIAHPICQQDDAQVCRVGGIAVEDGGEDATRLDDGRIDVSATPVR